MTFQTGKNIRVGYKVEGTFGTAPGASGAKVFRASPSSGLSLKKATVLPTEFRKDGMTPQGRHGSRSVDGGYDADLSVGTFDELLEAMLRGTWLPAFTITEATMTSITTTTAAIVAAAGSWITQGVRVGDVVRLTGHSTSANNSKNLRVLAVTASTIAVPTGDLVLNAVADTAFTLTVCKRLVMSDPPTGRSFSFEEYFQDIDGTELYKGCRVVGMTLKFQPDATVMVSFKVVGRDQEILTGASAPYYTTPTEYTSMPLVVVDGKVRVNGVDAVDFTSLEVTVDIGGSVQSVIGSNLTPDIFTNNAKISASLSALREDFDNANLFVNETQFDIHVLCVENDSEPKDFISFYFGNCKMMGNEGGIGNDNALIETIPVNIGKDETGGASAATMMLISTSAA